MTDIQNKNYIIALDQGTTSSRAIIFDRDANVVCTAQREFAQHYPQAGWVEHDPMEIFATQSAVMVEALAQAGLHHDQVAAIGIFSGPRLRPAIFQTFRFNTLKTALRTAPSRLRCHR